ncbi:hypothetical protein MBFIL_15960 [Methanobrevibacter filiformis]|uniref:DUF3800 domain-containing protein n=1 Tax=Methanobrevibacter filiformis TaxID=55758 RepID=A0A165ZNF9_9EURY|nr:hypothetical protein MBFIL_15960 [Methanobrevibacter filiformis]
MDYLFLDESGNLGLKGTGFMVISILRFSSLKECQRLKNIVKKVLNRKFRKEIKRYEEIKFYSMSVDLRKLL